MSLKGMNQITSIGVPQFAGAIVAARDKLIPVLVEAAIGEGQDVPLEFLHQQKLLLPLLLHLAHEL
jgi:hypothetical protein